MKAKDGSTIELVDNRISDADISQWNANAGQNFFATYGTTTIAEIEAAHAAGKAIFMSNDPLIIPLSVVSNGTAQFTFIQGNVSHVFYVNSSGWNHDTSNLQSSLTFDTTPTAGSTNPVTSGGIKNAIDSADAKGIVINEINGENVICFE